MGFAILFGPATDDSKPEKPDKVKVSGVVRDAQKNPVADATILINIPGNLKGKPVVVTTDKEGRYEKEIESAEPYDIFYSQSDSGMACVDRLSGQHNQNISIVLYHTKQIASIPPEAVFRELQAYEYASFLVTISPSYSALTENLRLQLGSKSVKERLDQFTTLKFADDKTSTAVHEKAKQVKVQIGIAK